MHGFIQSSRSMSPLTVSILNVRVPSLPLRMPEMSPLTVVTVPPNSSACSSSPEMSPLVEVNVRLCVSTSSSSRSPLVVSVSMPAAEMSSRSISVSYTHLTLPTNSRV